MFPNCDDLDVTVAAVRLQGFVRGDTAALTGIKLYGCFTGAGMPIAAIDFDDNAVGPKVNGAIPDLVLTFIGDVVCV